MIKGRIIYLTELDRDNAEIVRAWLNDPEIHRYLRVGHVPITREQELRYYDAHAASSTAYTFEIHLAENGQYVGNVGVENVDPIHRTCELGLVIGQRENWGRGYGEDAIVTCLGFAFDTLGLHRVELKCHEDNLRAAMLYRRVGFVEIGRERESAYGAARFSDHLLFDMLDREFRARHGEAARLS